MAKKTWEEKFAHPSTAEVKVNENGFADIKPGQTMLITTPQQIADFVSAMPKGTSASIKELRAGLAAKAGAEMSCPVVTGIHLRTVAEVTNAKLEAGVDPQEVIPIWRAIEPGAPITKKLEAGPKRFMALRAEGLPA